MSGATPCGTEADSSATAEPCAEIHRTVDMLNESIEQMVGDVERFDEPEIGDHTLAVHSDAIGPPETIGYDLANAADGESSTRVSLTALP